MGIDDVFEKMQAIQDAIDPPAFRKMRELHEAMSPKASAMVALEESAAMQAIKAGRREKSAIEELMERQDALFGGSSAIMEAQRTLHETMTGKFAGLLDKHGKFAIDPGSKIDALFDNGGRMGVATRLFEGMGSVGVAGKIADIIATQRHFDTLTGAGSAFESIRSLQDMITPYDNGLASNLEAFDRIERSLGPADIVSRHLRETALPSLSCLALPSEKPFALLAAMEGAKAASLVSFWQGSPVVAAFKPPSRREKPNLHIDANVHCPRCEQRLVGKGNTFTRLSDEGARWDLPTLPLCIPCFTEDPASYAERMVAAMKDPPFKLVGHKGGGQGSGKPTGKDHLRLVSTKPKKDEGGDG